MNVELVTRNKVTVAEIIGDLDHHTAKNMRSEIDREIKEHCSKVLILDFSKVAFMDSSGIGLIMGRYKLMEEMDGEVIVACPPTYIRKVLNLAGINRLAKIVSDYSNYFIDEKNKESENVEVETNK